MIRPATPDDAAAAVRVLDGVYPERLASVEAFRHRLESDPPRARRRTWVALEDAEVVGWAFAILNTESSEPGAAVAGVTVAAAARRRGHGAQLAEAVDAHLVEVGARRVVAGGVDEEGARAFASGRGWRAGATERISAVDPRAVPASGDPPAGVELRPFAALDEPTVVFELDREVSLDVPGEEEIDDLRLDEWLDRYWRHPLLDPEASLVAFVDGRPAGLTMLRSSLERRRAVNDITGVLRPYRGRGLARLLKSHALARLAGRGVELAYTENDETNVPMLAVNTALGYRPVGARVTFVRDA